MKFFILMLLMSYNVYAIDYGPAKSKAMDAGYVQTGLQNDVNLFVKYGKQQAYSLGLDKEIAVIGYGIASYRSKSLKIPMVLNNITTNIELYKDRLTITFGF